jgi:hypothetical protein
MFKKNTNNYTIYHLKDMKFISLLYLQRDIKKKTQIETLVIQGWSATFVKI